MQQLQKPLSLGHQFIELEQVNSTNTYAMQQIQAKLAQHGFAYFAHTQTNGRGRQGKVWQTQPKANIILSVVVNASTIGLSNQFYLSVVAALAVADLLNTFVTQPIAIKWPNDVYINDSKAAGILIENSLKGNKWQWAVIGIGVNINQTTFDTSLTNPTSVAAITGQQYHTKDAAKQLCSFLNIRYHQLLNGETENLLNTYNDLLYKKNQAVKLKKNNIAFNCIIQQVNAMGKLQVKDGLQDEFDFGEVEWILPNPAL